MNSELQASGKGLLKKCQALVLLRKQQENIDTTIDLMTACLPGLCITTMLFFINTKETVLIICFNELIKNNF